MSWDSYNRLINLSVPDISGSYQGYTWATVYDGFGRRVQTTYQVIGTNGLPSGTPATITYYYDPQVEFLELGQMVTNTSNSPASDRTWRVYGPDRSGVYGGAQGIGGIDNEVDEAGTWGNVPINNYFGDTVGESFVPTVVSPGYYDTYGYGSALGGYGYEPGSSVYSLTTQWRGHYFDYTGLVYMGARYYEPASGRFLSADPLGNASSMSLYDYCNGDPVNGLDPDGRWGKNAIEQMMPTDYENGPSQFTSGNTSYSIPGYTLDDQIAATPPGVDRANLLDQRYGSIMNVPEDVLDQYSIPGAENLQAFSSAFW